MATEKWFKDLLYSMKEDFDFRLESIILDITEKICAKMEQKNINRAGFAEILGVSKPAVTKILNGNSNFTLKTLLSIADALELDLRIQFEEKKTASIVSNIELNEQISDSTATVIPFKSEDYSPELPSYVPKFDDAGSGAIAIGG